MKIIQKRTMLGNEYFDFTPENANEFNQLENAFYGPNIHNMRCYPDKRKIITEEEFTLRLLDHKPVGGLGCCDLTAGYICGKYGYIIPRDVLLFYEHETSNIHNKEYLKRKRKESKLTVQSR